MSAKAVRLGAGLCLATLIAVCLLPLLYMILLAFLTQASFISTQPWTETLRTGWTLENFPAALQRTRFFDRLVVSFQLTGFVVLMAALFGLPAAHGIARLEARLARKLGFLFLSFRMLPAVAVCIPIFLLFLRPGLLPPWASLGLLQIGFNLPVLVWLTIPIFRSLPVETEELVQIDGLSRYRTLLLVVLPLLSRRLAGVLLIVAVLVWNETFFASIFRVETVTEVIPSLISHRGVQWGLVMAVGTMVALPALLLLSFVLTRRWGLDPEELG